MTPSGSRHESGIHVGRSLRQARQLLGWSLVEAASASEGQFKPSTLAAYERGDRQVTASALYRLAEVYQTRVHALLPIEEFDRVSTALSDRIERLPEPHRELVVALVDRMLRDTQAGAPGSRDRGSASRSR